MSTINALDDTGASRPPQPTPAAAAPASRVALKTDIVVIGAGQAGLSSAYHFKKRELAPGRGFVVLDRTCAKAPALGTIESSRKDEGRERLSP